MSRRKKITLISVATFLVVYVTFGSYVFMALHRPPKQVAAFLDRVPMPLFFAYPFPWMWNHARAGHLQPGDLAPDFELATDEGDGRVKLSDHRGERPVVLIFGSYT